MNFQPLFVFVIVSFLSLAESAPTLVQSAPEETAPISIRASNEVLSLNKQVFFRPSGQGRPPITRGAGSRNDRLCPQDATTNPDRSIAAPLSLTALVPDNQEGLTWSERPTVWVYLPETSARQMVLSIRTEGSQPHSQRFLPITGEPGIVGIPLDETAPPLDLETAYQWAVVLICGDRPSPNDPVVTAWVRRVDADQTNLPQDPLERAAWYGERGIWYDALTTLAEARRSQPANSAITEAWINFLTQPTVGLETIANEPVQ
jgi:hypothetical protein